MDTTKESIPVKVEMELNFAIAETVRMHQEEYEGTKQFSRNRVLDIETVIKRLLSKRGGSLQKELHEANVLTMPVLG